MANERELVDKLHDAKDVAKEIYYANKKIEDCEKEIIKHKQVIADPVPKDSRKKDAIGKHEQEAMDKENNRFIAERSAARKGAYKSVKGKGIAISIIALLISVGFLYLAKPVLAFVIGGVYALLTIIGIAAYAKLNSQAAICKTYRVLMIICLAASVLGAYSAQIMIQMEVLGILNALAFGAGLAVSAAASLINIILISKGLKVHKNAFDEKEFYDNSALVREARKLDAEEAAKADAELAAKIVKKSKDKIKELTAEIEKTKPTIPALEAKLDSIIVLPPKYRDLNGLGRLTGYILDYKQEYNGYPYNLDSYISYVEWKEQEREWKNEQARREAAEAIAQSFADMRKRQEDDIRRRSVERDLSEARRELAELNRKLDDLK